MSIRYRPLRHVRPQPNKVWTDKNYLPRSAQRQQSGAERQRKMLRQLLIPPRRGFERGRVQKLMDKRLKTDMVDPTEALQPTDGSRPITICYVRHISPRSMQRERIK